MRKIIPLLAVAALLLSACQAAVTTAEPTARPTTPPQPTLPPVDPERQPTAGSGGSASGPACTLVSSISFPTGESPFPAITASDWKQGPDSASIKILEYSDFM